MFLPETHAGQFLAVTARSSGSRDLWHPVTPKELTWGLQGLHKFFSWDFCLLLLIAPVWKYEGHRRCFECKFKWFAGAMGKIQQPLFRVNCLVLRALHARYVGTIEHFQPLCLKLYCGTAKQLRHCWSRDCRNRRGDLCRAGKGTVLLERRSGLRCRLLRVAWKMAQFWVLEVGLSQGSKCSYWSAYTETHLCKPEFQNQWEVDGTGTAPDLSLWVSVSKCSVPLDTPNHYWLWFSILGRVEIHLIVTEASEKLLATLSESSCSYCCSILWPLVPLLAPWCILLTLGPKSAQSLTQILRVMSLQLKTWISSGTKQAEAEVFLSKFWRFLVQVNTRISVGLLIPVTICMLRILQAG